MFKASIRYELTGREVSRDEFLRNMQNKFHRMVAENTIGMLTARLADVYCEAHDSAPTAVLLELSGVDVSFAFRDLCCDDLKAKCEKILKPTRGPSADQPPSKAP
jgi:hypothetical protein